MQLPAFAQRGYRKRERQRDHYHRTSFRFQLHRTCSTDTYHARKALHVRLAKTKENKRVHLLSERVEPYNVKPANPSIRASVLIGIPAGLW